MDFRHEPVLLNEVLEHLGTNFHPVKNTPIVFVDGTLGGAGHACALIEHLLLRTGDSRVHFLGIDQDAEALTFASQKLDTVKKKFDNRLNFTTVHDNFRNMQSHLERVYGPDAKADLVLADLGVSSFQLDTASRGFSLRHDGPLDMRMNPSVGQSALDLLNSLEEKELEEIFRLYGEEPRAKKLAHAIATDRQRAGLPFAGTTDFARYVERVLSYGYSRTSPAYRIFQALRIFVNDELGALQQLLKTIPQILSSRGRAGLISFHSLEDRIMKTAYREWEAEPSIGCEFPRGGLIASETEQSDNPRARSARLRVFCMGESRKSLRQEKNSVR